MLTWAYRDGNDVAFAWGPTDPFNYDYFIVRWSQSDGAPTTPTTQFDVRGGPRTSGRISLPRPTDQVGSDGHTAGWSFIVEGADEGGLLGSWPRETGLDHPPQPATVIRRGTCGDRSDRTWRLRLMMVALASVATIVSSLN